MSRARIAALSLLLLALAGIALAASFSVDPSIKSQTLDAGSSVTITGSVVTTGCGSATFQYSWDANRDGTYETVAPTYTYSAASKDGPTTDSINIKVEDTSATPCAAAATDTISLTIRNVAPALSASTVPTTLTEGASGTFTATASDVEGALDPLTYAWTFGDSSTAATASTTHAYADEGTYSVNLTVSDGDGGTAPMATKTVTVSNVAPTITSATGPSAGAEGAALAYTCAATDPGTADTLTTTWTFTDGASSTTGASITHAWRDNGAQTATCTVTDGDGGTVSSTVSTTVSNVAPTLSATTIPTTGNEGSSLSFSVTPADVGAADTFTYAWTFGDASSSTSQSPTHTYADEGSYTVNLTVTDDDGGTVSTSGTVVVSNVNPTASANGPTSGTEGSALTYTCTATDPGTADTISFNWSFSDGGTATGSSVNHTWTNQGSKTATCTATDGDGGSSTSTVTTTVSNANPSITASTIPAVGNEGSSLSFSVTASDPGADTLSYAWTFGDSGTSTSASPSHTYTDEGTYAVRVTVSDGDGGSATTTGSVVVSNVAPVISAVTGSNTGVEGSSLSYTCTASDAGTADTLTTTWTFTDGSSSSTGSSITQAWRDNGSQTATCTVTDADGGTDTATFSSTITNANPTISASTIPTSGNEGSTLSFSVTAADVGAADTFTYAWDFGDGSSATSRTPTHSYTDEGSYALSLVVSDDDGGTVSSNKTVVISNVNPTASASGASTASEGASVTYTCSGTDPGADTLSYAWAFSDGGTATGSSASHTWASQGTKTATCTVSDGDGGTGTASVTTTVSNAAPVIGTYSAPSSGTEGTAISLSAAATDAGGDPLTYAWTFGDGGTASGASATHSYADNGSYTILLTVTDGDGGSDTDTSSVAIANAAPTATATGSSTASEGVATTYTCTATDPGTADTFTYRWAFSDGTTATTASSSHTWTSSGAKSATCTVTDDDGATSTSTVSTTVSAVAPTLTAVIPSAGTEGSAITVSATARGADPAEVFTYAWTFGDGGTATGSAATHAYVDNGTYTVTATATDSDGLTASVSGAVVVANANPTATVTGSSGGAEGTALSLTCTAADVGTADTFTYAWTFGDGATATGATASHAYADNGSFTATCTVTDDDGGTGSGTRGLAITNVAPTLSGSPLTATTDAVLYTFTPVLTDPGTGDTHSYTLTGLPATASLSSSGTVSWTPLDTEAGTYTVTLSVRDDDGGTGSLSWSLTVTFLDADGDGLSDAEEARLGTDPTLVDTDGDTLSDFDEVTSTLTDPTTPFTDSDALDDGAEVAAGLDPLDGDMDEDGLPDDIELGLSTDPTLCDSDGDGLSDGLEEGTSSPDLDTDLSTTCFLADADPASTTSPTAADTDGDTLSDGAEDVDGDGQLDATETDPNLPDTDADLLDDAAERSLGTDGRDADSDEDGLTDGLEQRSLGTDPLTCDTDGDGLSDGLERGITSATAPADTVTTAACFASDTDPSSTTSPLDTDSDDDSLSDGVEDPGGTGAVGVNETDPTLADSDGDGVPDGEETDWELDTDGDGDINALDIDADDDGLIDSLEVGTGPSTPIGDDADGLLTAEIDTDLDGLANMVDDDDDNDSVLTTEEDATADFDLDGLVDYLDPDDDDDGFSADDCGHLNPAIYPGAPEITIDGIDQDCDGGDICLADADADGYYDESATQASGDTVCGNASGEARVGDIDGDGDVDLGQDRNSDGTLDYGFTVDGLAVDLPGDCDDLNPSIHPNGGDACEDYGTTQIDNDCDGDPNTVSHWDDAGTPTVLTDDVFVTEAVTTDEFPFYEDKDYDGFGDENAPAIFPCEPPDALTEAEKEAGVIAYVPSSGDCDDENEYVYPGADELCNGLDEDCDDIADEPEDLGPTSGCALSYSDHDKDGFGSDLDADQLCLCFDGVPSDPTACPAGDYELTDDGTCYTNQPGDCYDYDAHIYDGAPERLDGDDNNCDGLVAAVELDCDDDGSLPLRASEVGLADDESLTRAALGLDQPCTDGAEIELQCWGLPVRLTCNSDELWSANRNDDGVIEKFSGGSRVYAAGRFTFTAGDCDDQCAARYPGATEVCDGRDNDCDLGSTVADDDADGLINQIEVDAARLGRISPEELDLDGDGYVACASVPTEEQTVLTSASCSTTVVENALFSDCNDLCALSNPVAEEERCDGFLDICDGAGESSDQDEDGHGTCGLGGTPEGSALSEDLYMLVWYTDKVAPGPPARPADAFPQTSVLKPAEDSGLPEEEEGDILPLLLPRPEAALCDQNLEAAISARIGEDVLDSAVEALVQGQLATAMEPLLQLCIAAEAASAISSTAGHCAVVRLTLSATADDELPDEEELAALGIPDCALHPEQQTWRTVWSRERSLAARRLVQEWECYRSAGTYGCGDLTAPAGWVNGSGPTPGGAFTHRVPDALLDNPEWTTEIGRFSPAAITDGILYGCWDPVEIDAREGQTVGGDCSDGRESANREQPEGPGDLLALYSPDNADLATCDRCLDGVDNNCDGTIDCADPTCAACFVGQGRGCASPDSPCAQAGCAATPNGPLLPTGAALLGLSLAAAGLRRRRR